MAIIYQTLDNSNDEAMIQISTFLQRSTCAACVGRRQVSGLHIVGRHEWIVIVYNLPHLMLEIKNLHSFRRHPQRSTIGNPERLGVRPKACILYAQNRIPSLSSTMLCLLCQISRGATCE
mmetsp:Transcript_20745/g.61904  ORF Transcript_20745/g.61904 Transcript_20745/m.61904 type:complete len:120 (+) Transcript_20745:556-915(+)